VSSNPSLEVKARKEPLCSSAAFSFDVSVSPVEKERRNSKLNEILQLSASRHYSLSWYLCEG
jgi:hypothetical protein